MNRVLLLVLSLSIFGTAAAALAAGPNIIVIMPDDQGYGDLGITGNPVIRTPHIDALARQSASLTNFYVCPVCSPTRASVMTGRYHYRTRVVDTFKGRSMMDPAEVTIAELLREAGYATGIFGKWHLGDNYPLRPIDQGFDESFIHKGGGLGQPSEPLENARRYTNPILFDNGQAVQTKGYCTDLYFEAAMQFADEAQAAGKPFFIYLPPNAPHSPYHDVPAEPYRYYKSIDLSPVLGGRQQDADRVARIYAMIENIDDNVGRLHEHLAKKGLEENTLILFLVDNGPNTRRYVGPFRGMKTEVHEGGIRSPFFAHWPARLAPGTTSDRVAAHIDILPTLLDAAEVAVPDDLQLDGVSLLPWLEGKQGDAADRSLFIQVHRGDKPIPFHHVAVRTDRWKLVHPTGFQKSQMPADVPFELYDIRDDPRELHDLAAKRQDVVDELKQEYLDWFADVSSTRPDNYAPPRIVVGSPEETESVLSRQDWRVVEDAGWGHRGSWMIDVEQAGDYEAELIMEEPVGPGDVILRLGERTEKVPFGEKTDQVSVELDGVPAGPTTILAVIDEDSRQVDPYQLLLRRKD